MTAVVWAAMAASASASATPFPPAGTAAHYGAGPNYCKAYGNRSSQYSFENIYACATTQSNGRTPFDSAGNVSFQCVELSIRFLWAIYGIGSPSADGWDLVSLVHAAHPKIPIGRPGPGSVPLPGDIVSLGPGYGVARAGHTGVVVKASAAKGTFSIISQNFPFGRAGEQQLEIALGGGHNGSARIGGVWTPASWLKLAKPKTTPVPPTPTPTPSGCAPPGSTLASGATLCAGTELTSSHGQYKLIMQTDGNLVLYNQALAVGHRAIWQTHTFSAGDHLVMQASDGNLVIYDGSGHAVWQAHTYPHPGDHLVVQDDGNVVVYAGSTALWSTGT